MPQQVEVISIDMSGISATTRRKYTLNPLLGKNSICTSFFYHCPQHRPLSCEKAWPHTSCPLIMFSASIHKEVFRNEDSVLSRAMVNI